MFNRFDVCEAYYVFAMLYHAGQDDRVYEILGRLEEISFRPRFSLRGPENLSDNARSIFDALLEKHGFEL